MFGGRRSNKGKEKEEEVLSTILEETTPTCQSMKTMDSFFQSSYGGFHPPNYVVNFQGTSFTPQYLFQSIPSFKPPTTLPSTTLPSTTQPILTQPFITQPITTNPYSMYVNPPISSLSFPKPSFSQSLSLPSLSESQKLSPTNYQTWHLFMQLLLESAGVWQIIANPLLVDPAYRSYMDSCAKALMVHGMSSSIVAQFLSQGTIAQQLWISIQNQFGRVSTVKVARLEEELDKLSFLESDNVVDKLGEFTRIKRQLEEYGTQISNPVHKLLGKLPSSFESFKDNIYLCVPFPSFDKALGLLHDKCLSRKSSSKKDAAFLGQAQGKPNTKGKGNTKGKNASSHEAYKKGNKSLSNNKQEECSFCGLSNHKEERCFAKQRASKAAKDEVKSKPSSSSTSNNKDKKEESQAKVACVAHATLSSSSTSSPPAHSYVVISEPTPQDLEDHSKGEWIADSGASAHMTHSSSHFEN